MLVIVKFKHALFFTKQKNIYFFWMLLYYKHRKNIKPKKGDLIMKMRLITLLLFISIFVLSITVLAEETDYSYLEDMTVKELKELRNAIDKLLKEDNETETEYEKIELTAEQDMIKNGYNAIKETLLDPESIIIYDCYGFSDMTEELYDSQYKLQKEDPNAILPDDLFIGYYHIGARNKLGGISEETYLIVFDYNTLMIKDYGTKSDYKNEINKSKRDYKNISIDVCREFALYEAQIATSLTTGRPWEKLVDYKEYIKSLK